MAAPRRRHRSTGTSSSSPTLSSQPFASCAQKTRLARGQVSRALSTRPPSMGNQIRYGSRLSGSGLRATRKRGGGLTGSCWLARMASGSHRLSVVLADQTAQPHAPSDPSSSGDSWIAWGGRWSQLAAAVRTFLVVVRAIPADDRLEVALVHHKHPVQTLPPTASDPALDVALA